MLLWIAVLLSAFFAAFLFISLRRTTDQNVDSSIDAFIDHSDSDIPAYANSSSSESRYKRTYTCEGWQVLLAFATEYGCSEQIARVTHDKILALSAENHENQWQPRIINLKHYDKIDFTKESVIIFICSTAGDGVPPTEARPFFEYMNNGLASIRTTSCLQFAVMALGDSNYPHFCRAGQQLDHRLHEMGGSCLLERVDIDQEDWDIINTWLDTLVERLDDIRDDIPVCMDYLGPMLLDEEGESGFHRTRPFMAVVTDKHMLTVVKSPNDRETVHIDFDLTGSNLEYSAGDALGVWPKNSPPEVCALLMAMNCSGSEQVECPSWAYYPRPQDGQLFEALLLYYDLKTVQLSLLKLLKESVQNEHEQTEIERLLEKGMGKGNDGLKQYFAEREVVDVLEDFRSNSCSWKAILQHLKPLQPRYYSIASSPKLNANMASVCAAVVRYSTLSKSRTGVATTFMQDRLSVGDQCPVFISHNPDFRLPSDASRPIVMIGPGTGLAPFRAFIQERSLEPDCGRNLLYFGCRNKLKDYLYSDELESYVKSGSLQLRTAFSRDQPQKVYVQHLIQQDSIDLVPLIQGGAHLYVCGDAKFMAPDVHRSLLAILQSSCGISVSMAEHELKELEQQGRYQKDVWVT